jgi:hypothetical protein
MGYADMLTGEELPMFRRDLLPLPSGRRKVKKSSYSDFERTQSKLFRKVGNYLLIDTALYSRRHEILCQTLHTASCIFRCVRVSLGSVTFWMMC